METLTITFFALLILLIVGVFFFFIFAFIYNTKLNSYLKKENYDKWCDLTIIWNMGPGGSNPFKWFPYIYGNLDNENEIILKYKKKIRFGLRKSFFLLLGLFLNIIVLAIMIKLLD